MLRSAQALVFGQRRAAWPSWVARNVRDERTMAGSASAFAAAAVGLGLAPDHGIAWLGTRTLAQPPAGRLSARSGCAGGCADLGKKGGQCTADAPRGEP